MRLPGHEVRLTAADEKLWPTIEPLLAGEQRFRPPRVRDIGATIGVGEAHVRRLFKLLGRLGKVVEIAHDHFFLRGTVAEMVGSPPISRYTPRTDCSPLPNSAIGSTTAVRSPSRSWNSSIAMA